MNPELEARLEALEAERLRPVPARPAPLPPAIADALRAVMDRLVELDDDGRLGDEEAR